MFRCFCSKDDILIVRDVKAYNRVVCHVDYSRKVGSLVSSLTWLREWREWNTLNCKWISSCKDDESLTFSACNNNHVSIFFNFLTSVISDIPHWWILWQWISLGRFRGLHLFVVQIYTLISNMQRWQIRYYRLRMGYFCTGAPKPIILPHSIPRLCLGIRRELSNRRVNHSPINPGKLLLGLIYAVGAHLTSGSSVKCTRLRLRVVCDDYGVHWYLIIQS